MKRPRYLGRDFVDVVPDLIDLTRHLTQHLSVLVLDAKLEGIWSFSQILLNYKTMGFASSFESQIIATWNHLKNKLAGR